MRSSSKVAITLAAGMLIGEVAQAQQVRISQYYEGTATNKWIELKVIGPLAVDFTAGGWTLGLWTNANAEGYKTGTAPSTSVSLAPLGTVAAGVVVLLNNTASTLPGYAVANMSPSTVINFNGNDSIALFTGGLPFATANVVDAIGFTNAGNEGADKSFVRTSFAPGWNTTAGSNATTFPTIWASYTNAQVDAATSGDPQYLGQSTLPVELQHFEIK